MGKTIKKLPYSYFRNPKGHKKYLADEEVRKGAIPPSAWDDLPHDRQAWAAYLVGRKMAKQGMSDEEILQRLRERWKLTHPQAMRVLKRLR
jgi:hypothetical protein